MRRDANNQDLQLPDQGRRGGRAGRTAARGRQGSPEASARALGLLRPRTPRPSEPASERASERSQSAAGSQSGRTRGGGWQERWGASQPISLLGHRATRARATRTRGPGPGPKVRSPQNPAPQLGVVGTPPRGHRGWGLAGSGPAWGCLGAPLFPRGGGGGRGETPPDPVRRSIPHSVGAWTAGRSPVYPSLPELCAQCLESGLRVQGSPFSGRGSEAPIRERRCVGRPDDSGPL